MKKFLCASLSIFSTLACLPAHADYQWGLGIGGMIENQGYTDIGTETTVIPMIYLQTEKLRIYGPTINYQLASLGDLDFSIAGQYRFDGYDADDGDIFKGMDDRTGTFEIGFSLNYGTEFGDLSFDALTDIGSEHDGYEVSLAYSKPFMFDPFMVEPFVRISMQSEDLVNYYYGVRENEITDYRAFYEADSTTNAEIGVRTNWRVGKRHNLLMILSYTAFGSEIKDSPLVDKSGGGTFILGYTYAF